MFRLLILILLSCALSIPGYANQDLQAKYIEVNLNIDVPGSAAFTPALVLKLGHQATIRRTSEAGEGLRLDIVATNLFVDQKGRPIAELDWKLYSVSKAGTTMISETTTAVIAGSSSEATFKTASTDEKVLVTVSLTTRVVPDSELLEKFGTKTPEVKKCDEAAESGQQTAKRGDCCYVPCGVGLTLTCCGAVYCCCEPGICCYPP